MILIKTLTTTDPSIAYNVYKGIPDMVTVNDGPVNKIGTLGF